MLGFIITFIIICCIGIPLNGIVIWLLGFQMKRNPFTVLILNLASADFGYLVFLAVFCIHYFTAFWSTGIPYFIIRSLFHIMHINSLFLLAAISIDRCMAVLFPIWHRCSRPKHLSSAVCAFLWICSVLLGGGSNIMRYILNHGVLSNLHLIVTSMVCLPLITISSVILFIRICLKPKQIKRGRLLVMISITLLCFLILTLPLYIYMFINHFRDGSYWKDFLGLENYLALGASLNSSINPVIYYLVGRKKRAQTRESIKVIFQRVFKEDEVPEITEEARNRVSTPV